ncbi:MAG: FtsX-like permease family protein [Cellulosilyticaceae bacterium]
MYFKLAFRNVKKSYKDYMIYFLTLTLAICIFYTFNSVESQKAFVEMEASGKNYATVLVDLMGYVSVFVSVILGSLIIYANHFLIKRRNKEFGTYMILGMSKSKISSILSMETLLVGLSSLASGLALGLVVSQGLSVLVSQIFEIPVSDYTFMISVSAIQKTVIYFGIMFVTVMLFNAYVMSQYKIIDLLTAGKKVQDIKFKSTAVYGIAFGLCVCCIGVAYQWVFEVGLDLGDIKLIGAMGLGVIGTGLFFFSLAGIVLSLLKRSKRVYFKGLNLFVIKQMSSKVNTHFVSMTVICLMLFFTITILSTGLGFKQALESGLEEATPYDASAIIYINERDPVKSIAESLDRYGLSFEPQEAHVFFDIYRSEVKVSDVMPQSELASNLKMKVQFIKISDYNKLIALDGEVPIVLEEDEILIASNVAQFLPDVQALVKNTDELNIEGQTYKLKSNEVVERNLYTRFAKDNFFTIIINDAFCEAAQTEISILNVNFNKENPVQSKEKFEKVFTDYRLGMVDYEKVGYLSGYTREEIYMENRTTTITILFIGIYLGLIFLISSMAVLALQQLSEASESIERYTALKKIGASKASINKTILVQTLIYFSIPITLALVHSVVGIWVANDFISQFNAPNMGMAVGVTVIVFLLVYSGYFYTTYITYKNIVSSKIK